MTKQPVHAKDCISCGDIFHCLFLPGNLCWSRFERLVFPYSVTVLFLIYIDTYIYLYFCGEHLLGAILAAVVTFSKVERVERNTHDTGKSAVWFGSCI